MYRGLISLVSFLTILPTRNSTLENTANNMHLFPVVGIFLGVIFGLVGFGLDYVALDSLIIGLILVGVITIVTGLHHIDGLSDFADGMMTSGSAENKRQAMKDVKTGTAGTLSLLLYLLGMIIVISKLDGIGFIYTLLIAETLAKFSMVLITSLNNSATLGSNTPFVHIMKDRRRVVVAFAITIIPISLLAITGDFVGFAALASVVILVLIISYLAKKHLGGLTGDVIGVTNELSRLFAISVMVL
ncbi:MAG: adenosylcobinamide-GDP ribazoletransferase [Candidatus Nitrosoabyssus spongiisocia]|nr:MAG: adenosylcobinamide-GDP ribazoletransferase [Nitrosopumilaceae archaeon AB1(1)]